MAFTVGTVKNMQIDKEIDRGLALLDSTILIRACTYLQTGRLFVRNLAYTCTEEDLEEEFKKFGNYEVLLIHCRVKVTKGHNLK